jgi:hypothetical protein
VKSAASRRGSSSYPEGTVMKDTFSSPRPHGPGVLYLASGWKGRQSMELKFTGETPALFCGQQNSWPLYHSRKSLSKNQKASAFGAFLSPGQAFDSPETQ